MPAVALERSLNELTYLKTCFLLSLYDLRVYASQMWKCEYFTHMLFSGVWIRMEQSHANAII